MARVESDGNVVRIPLLREFKPGTLVFHTSAPHVPLAVLRASVARGVPVVDFAKGYIIYYSPDTPTFRPYPNATKFILTQKLD